MEPSDLFRKALASFLDGKGRGSQRKLAETIGIPASLLNDFLKSRRPISEAKREQIATYCGYTYEEFVAFGRKLMLEENGDTNEVCREEKIEPIHSKNLTTIEVLQEYNNSLKKQNDSLLEEKTEWKAERSELKNEISELKERIKFLETQLAMTAETDVKKIAG